jgi:metal-sulfur cluster biosynthetic enzyme
MHCRRRGSLDSSAHLIRTINDPEHPLNLEELRVAQLLDVTVDNANSRVSVQFTPTIPHCSMATLIGLSIRVRLLRSLPPRFKVRAIVCRKGRVSRLDACVRCVQVDVRIHPGTHASEEAGLWVPACFVRGLHGLTAFAVNKQLSDKERVAAALENAQLLGVVNKCLAPNIG